MLKVNENCIGCGACMAIDADHFNVEGPVSEVITQDNITDATREAVNSCPVGAIELTEDAEKEE